MITETESVEELQEQMDRLEAKLDRILEYTHNLEIRVEGLGELKEDFVPIVNDAAKLASHKLMQFEATGGMKAATGIGRSLADPHFMKMVHRALQALVEAQDGAGKPPSLFKALRDPEIRRGMAVMFAVLRALGETAPADAPTPNALPATGAEA